MKLKIFITFLLVVCAGYGSFAQKVSFGKFWSSGKNEYKLKDFAKADEALRKALEIKPKHYGALVLHGKTLGKTGNFVEASQRLQSAIEIKPTEELYLLLTDAYIKLSQFEKAEDAASKALEVNLKSVPAIQKRTYARIELKKFKEGLQDIERALTLNNKHHLSYFYKAVCHDSLKEYAAARLSYEKAIYFIEPAFLQTDAQYSRIPANKQEYYVNLGKVLYKLSIYDKAIENYTKSFKIDPADQEEPKDYYIFYLRAHAYNKLNEFASALDDLHRSLALNNSFADAFVLRARIYKNTSQLQSAISDYTKVLLLNDHYQYYFERGQCYLEFGRYQEALSDFNKVLAMNPEAENINENIRLASLKLYDANKETNPPVIKLLYPVADHQGFVNISLEQMETILMGEVIDQSLIKSIKINGKDAVFYIDQLNPKFTFSLNNITASKIEIAATDIYENTSSLNFRVGRILSDAKLRYDFSGRIFSDDQENKPLSNLQVFLVNKRGEKIATAVTDGAGNFVFEKLPYDKSEFSMVLDSMDSQLKMIKKIVVTDRSNKPILFAEKSENNSFRFEILPYDALLLSLMTVDDAPLNLNIKGKMIDGDDMKTPLAFYTINLIDENGDIIDTKKTDAFGAFLFTRAPRSRNYLIKIAKEDVHRISCNKVVFTDDKGLVIKEITKNTFGEFTFEILPQDQFLLSTITEEDPWMRIFNLGKKRTELEIIENIYYESGAWQVPADAIVILEKVVSALKANPKVILKVESHTDSQAGDDFNLELSRKRATAVVDQLIASGIDKKRLTGLGLGETILANRCGNGVECSDAEHRQNRRTIFKLTYQE
jgi:tetratricopeptide (TPR) repeat protein/outer membrane protein OmpA-like peptidoglycan-associated protein